jgi:hypothetical protein
MVLRTIRRWGEMWRVRRFWRLRLAMSVVLLGVFAWMWFGDFDLSNRLDFYVFVVALSVPTVFNLVFWRSDAQAERDRKDRLRHG